MMRPALFAFFAVGLGAACAQSPPPPPTVAIPTQPPALARDAGVTRNDRVAALTAPPVRALDPTLPMPTGLRMIVATPKQALFELFFGMGEAPVLAVVSLESGCFEESYPPFLEVQKLHDWEEYGSRRRSTNEAGEVNDDVLYELSRAELGIEMRSLMGLVSRFGGHARQDIAWSPDGSKVLVVAASLAYLSRDAGKTFQRVDDHSAHLPHVTRDGRWGLSLHCRVRTRSLATPRCEPDDNNTQYALFATDDAAAPVSVGPSEGWFEGELGGHLAFSTREPGKLCIDLVDPTSRAMRRAFCVAMPKLSKDRGEPFLHGSPQGAYAAAVSFDEPDSSLILLSMTDGRVVSALRQPRFDDVVVDERGRAAWQTATMKVGVAWEGGTKILGAGRPLGWAPSGRLIVEDDQKPSEGSASLLAAKRCELVRVVDVTP